MSDALLRKLRVQDGSTVLYPTFKSRVNVCVLLLGEYVTLYYILFRMMSKSKMSMWLVAI